MQRICYSEFQKTLHFCLLGALVISMLMVSSCSSIRNTAYFSTLSKDTTIQQFVSSSFESKIQKNDYLSIVVSSLSAELDLKFNAGAVNSLPTGATENSFGFLVNEGGSVMLHFIGNLPVEGLTCKELQKKLENDLLPYLKEPIVKVGFLYKKITILGEITKPQIYYMQDEQISLVDLIVNSGDLKENANKSKIMID